jgi:hypothetical protein
MCVAFSVNDVELVLILSDSRHVLTSLGICVYEQKIQLNLSQTRE